MTTYFISRHAGAHEWAHRQGFHHVEVISHLDDDTMTDLQPDDVVIGTLPIHLAARVCMYGARFEYLELTIPPEARGKELTADDMERFGARLQEYKVVKV